MRTCLAILTMLLLAVAIISCQREEKTEFKYQTEKFADLQILRYQVPGFEQLTARQKELLYYLYQAALSGRDIIYDQNYKHNLLIRRTLEAVVNSYTGDRTADEFQKFMVYAKRVWFANGIHHHYSTIKFLPEFSQEYFAHLVTNSPEVTRPLTNGGSPDDLITKLAPILFDPEIDAKRVNLDPNADQVLRSANNYYEGITQREVEAYYAKVTDKNDPTPIAAGLNSKLVRENGEVTEKVWKVGGMYSPAIAQIVHWLEKASAVAEKDKQKAALDKLIEFYRTGNLQTFDDYSIAWVGDVDSRIDVVNGFIEVYGDPLGYRGGYESVVSIKDLDATKRIEAIGKQAQWFEEHSPIMGEHKKQDVVGISAKVITVVVEAGDTSPSSPVGINLPNANWIRTQHGSKSVTLGNINDAYDESSRTNGMLEEFSHSTELVEMEKQYGSLADNLHTDMHEVIGHASGKINEGVGTPKQTLKSYGSTIEEARADLVALYFILDPKLVEIGVMPSLDVGRVAYHQNIRNGLMTQLRRLKLGENIEEAHMRNRQIIAKWVYERGLPENVIEKQVNAGKTYFVINDYEKLRELFGQLLRETQRITSEGDYEAAKNLVETYGVVVDPALHAEVLARVEKLNVAPYSGFINPKLVPVMEGDRIVDVKMEYPEDFTQQMLDYAREYSFLPNHN